MNRTSGEFQVKMAPLEGYSPGTEGNSFGRMSIDKTLTGGLTGSSVGEMLSVMTSTKGSAGYVALEQFSGTLEGREGGFVLQHSGMLDRGADSLVVRVVPDSGVGELAGISGELAIQIEGGKHLYVFRYQLPG